MAPPGALLSGDGQPVSADEVGRRGASIGLLAKVVLSALAAGGAIFTLGSKWNDAGTRTAVALETIAATVNVNGARISALEGRVRTVEETRLTLAPAVVALTAQVGELGKGQTDMRVGVADLVAEIRNLKEAVVELRSSARGPK